MIRLAVRVPRAEAELVLAELLELSPGGLEEVEVDAATVEYAVYGAPGELPALPDLRALAGGSVIEVSTTEVADDWRERWRDFHRPVLIGAPAAGSGAPPSLRVRPPWEPPASGAGDALEIVIDPGQAFGTGAHASTHLCLELLLVLAAQEGTGPAVLDVGTGSGVLAIAAGLLGFSPLLALDNDREGVRAARANAAVNGVELEARRVDLRAEPLPWVGPGAAAPVAAGTVVLANLLRPLLLELAGAIESAPAALIAGGLLEGELDEVRAAFAGALGLAERERRVKGGWGALLLSANANAFTGR